MAEINKKRGSIVVAILTLTVLLLMVILSLAYLLYCQITVQLTGIKNDIFLVCQNAIMEYNKDELGYGSYQVDIDKLKERIENLIIKNNMEGKPSIKKIAVKEIAIITDIEEIISHNANNSEPFLHIVVEVHVKPVSNILGDEIKIIRIHEDIKISLMKY